jgi:DNA-binding GntR family transcriptional regulator
MANRQSPREIPLNNLQGGTPTRPREGAEDGENSGNIGPLTEPEGDAGYAGPPAYLKIASTLAERITSGAYPPGSRLPSGSQLCKDFGVSPMTVRRALAILHNQGLVSAEQGRGTFARSVDLADTEFRLDSRSGEWLDSSAEIRLLSAAMTRADEEVASMLKVPLGSRVIYLRRLVSYDGSPAMYHTEYITYDPRRPLVESQLQLTSLHAFLDSGRAQRFPRGELTLTAVPLDAESARALDRPQGSFALRLEHVFRQNDRTPVSWGWFLLRAEHFRMRARLGPE